MPHSFPHSLLKTAQMEHPSRAAAASATPYEGHAEKSGRITQLWRSIAVKMFYLLWRISGLGFAAAEIQQKSLLSERHRYLLMDAQKPAACLHPGQPIRSANQYATWTVCPKCSARLTYASKHIQPKGKAKARACASGYQAPPDPAGGAGTHHAELREAQAAQEESQTQAGHPWTTRMPPIYRSEVAQVDDAADADVDIQLHVLGPAKWRVPL